MHRESLKRLPIYSLASGAILAAVLVASAISGIPIPSVGLGALGFLPLAAAFVDAVRLSGRSWAGGAGQGGSAAGLGDRVDTAAVQEWLEERADALAIRERDINSRALAIQQWMQFPDAIDFKPAGDSLQSGTNASRPRPADDPMARHDRELIELIERKTRDLFDSIKQDAYRKDEAGRKVFDNERIRLDVVALISEVAAIYRPGETNPLLKTNVEALSRAVGRGSLRLLVAVESFPGGLASYDFQSIYTLVIRAVKTFGIYKSAKPYIDVASSVLFAGRIVSSTNPLTLVAWWAASKATTYGASKLGTHVLDQQAVGLIRQLVEIVAIEVASIYSPMVRYRDVHWIYGVELVHMAGELEISDSARVAAMKQISALNLRDEYGRVSLIRHLADGTTSRPTSYNPSGSLSASDRKIVAERLEAFLLAHVIGNKSRRHNKSAIEAWQAAAAERLEIQFRAGPVDATAEQQSENAIWALAAFALQHFGDEPEQTIQRLHLTKTWQSIPPETQSHLENELRSTPPYLYHPPCLDPDAETCQRFLDDLVELAGRGDKPSPTFLTAPVGGDPVGGDPVGSQSAELPPWSGEEALRVTAYYLRSDANRLMDRYFQTDALYLLRNTGQTTLPRNVARVLHSLGPRMPEGDLLRCVYSDGVMTVTKQTVALARFDSALVCFRIEPDADDALVRVETICRCPQSQAKIEKVAGYVRSDCRVTFPEGTEVLIPGSTLSGYDAYFSGLLQAK